MQKLYLYQELENSIIRTHIEQLWAFRDESIRSWFEFGEIESHLLNGEIHIERRDLLTKDQQVFDQEEMTVDRTLSREGWNRPRCALKCSSSPFIRRDIICNIYKMCKNNKPSIQGMRP